MKYSPFGTDATKLGRDETCCAPNCETQSVLAGPELPLCENHLKMAYRRIGDYLRTKDEHPDNKDRSGNSDGYELLGLPSGLCPKCNQVTLSGQLMTGDVRCIRSGCGYHATKGQYSALLELRAAEYRAEKEVVYYVRFGDRIKIGTTKNLVSRLAAIPHDELLATEPGGVAVERRRHKQFEHLRTEVGTSREWFEMTPELVEHIAALKARQAA